MGGTPLNCRSVYDASFPSAGKGPMKKLVSCPSLRADARHRSARGKPGTRSGLSSQLVKRNAGRFGRSARGQMQKLPAVRKFHRALPEAFLRHQPTSAFRARALPHRGMPISAMRSVASGALRTSRGPLLPGGFETRPYVVASAAHETSPARASRSSARRTCGGAACLRPTKRGPGPPTARPLQRQIGGYPRIFCL
jgi:hypothetical protein